jgi:hypothetical protein
LTRRGTSGITALSFRQPTVFSAALEDPMLRASQFATALRATVGRSYRPAEWRLVRVRVAYLGVLSGKRPSDIGTRLKPR